MKYREIGPVIAKAFVSYFAKEQHVEEFRRLLNRIGDTKGRREQRGSDF